VDYQADGAFLWRALVFTYLYFLAPFFSKAGLKAPWGVCSFSSGNKAENELG
jgi:hypothetical protein